MNAIPPVITCIVNGFGQALTKEAIAQRHRVIGTVRNESTRRSP